MRLFVCFIILYVYSKFFIHICGNLILLAIWYELPNDFENSSKSNSVKSLMVIEVEDSQARCLLYPSIATSQILIHFLSFEFHPSNVVISIGGDCMVSQS